MSLTIIVECFSVVIPESPAFEVLPSLKRLKLRIIAAGRGQYDAVFMSGRYKFHYIPRISKIQNLIFIAISSGNYYLYF